MLREHVGGQFFNLGYQEEISYWRSLGGVGSTCTDVMVSYLSSQGYTGTPYDMFSGWVQAQKSVGGLPWDSARALVRYK